MATRAHIIVKNSEKKCYIYHHWDGYPEGVGKGFREYLNKYKDLTDPKEFCKAVEAENPTYEFENEGLHGDEEFVYVVDFDNYTYTCYNTKKSTNGTDWWDIPESEVYNCEKEFEESFKNNDFPNELKS